MAVIAYELAAAGLQNSAGRPFSEAINEAFNNIPSSVGLHRVIDSLAMGRPAAAAYLKAAWHSGAYMFDDESAAEVIEALRSAGFNDVVLRETCRRLEISDEVQIRMGLPLTFQPPIEDAARVVGLISGLSDNADEAAAIAAEEMGWTLPELLAYSDSVGDEPS